MEDIRVSICIATYNGEKYISEQLNSIIRQCGEKDEIIISDDNSIDKTWKILEKYSKDKRIKIYKNQGQKGYTSNFENALKKANGRYIFLSDQDDKWHENKIEICLKYLKSFDLVISDCFIVDQNMNIILNSYFELRGKKQKNFYTMLYKTNYLGCCMAFKKEILEKALPFPSEKNLCPHDLWLGLIAYRYYKVKALEEKLIYYRRHDKNVSTGGIKGKNLYFKLKYRYYVFKEIIKRK